MAKIVLSELDFVFINRARGILRYISKRAGRCRGTRRWTDEFIYWYGPDKRIKRDGILATRADFGFDGFVTRLAFTIRTRRQSTPSTCQNVCRVTL